MGIHMIAKKSTGIVRLVRGQGNGGTGFVREVEHSQLLPEMAGSMEPKMG